MATKPTNNARKKRRDWRPAFLKALETEGTVLSAARVAGVNRQYVYQVRQRDEEFALAWADAEEAVTEKLERRGVELAMSGDSRLLEFFLKARRPDRYRDNVRIEHSGPDGRPIELAAPEDSLDRSARAARLLAHAGALNGSTHANGNGAHP